LFSPTSLPFQLQNACFFQVLELRAKERSFDSTKQRIRSAFSSASLGLPSSISLHPQAPRLPSHPFFPPCQIVSTCAPRALLNSKSNLEEREAAVERRELLQTAQLSQNPLISATVPDSSANSSSPDEASSAASAAAAAEHLALAEAAVAKAASDAAAATASARAQSEEAAAAVASAATQREEAAATLASAQAKHQEAATAMASATALAAETAREKEEVKCYASHSYEHEPFI